MSTQDLKNFSDKNGGFNKKNMSAFLVDNVVTIIFAVVVILGLLVATGVSFSFLLNELTSRFFRNIFLTLSLIIPVVAGLGLNFGIVIGAMAAQLSVIIVRYHGIGGVGGLVLCALIALPIASLFGLLTGLLYNKTRGQEMIASLIVGFFANGIYQFILLFAVGNIIKVPMTHPMIKPDGIGVRVTVDLIPIKSGGLKSALDSIFMISFPLAVCILSALLLAYVAFGYVKAQKNPALPRVSIIRLAISCGVAALAIGMGIFSMATNSFLADVRNVPVATSLVIAALCLFNALILRTKLGQNFRSVGQSQHIAEISGINVDRTRIIATMMSTVLAAWGQLIYLQNMGTLNTYDAHTQIGMFSVAAILVGGASTAKANVKHALVGTVLFNAMFIMSPEIGQAVFGNPLLGEYFRTFMVYGVIGLSLGLYVWKNVKASRYTVE